MPMWRTWLIDMMTGDRIKTVDPSDFPWSTGIAGDGDGTATFVLPDESELTEEQVTAARNQRRADFRPNSHGLAVLWGDTVAYVGKIEGWDYSRDGARVLVQTVELRGEFEWRMTYGVNVYEQGTLTVTSRTHAGAARAVLARFMQWSPDFLYPIDLPPDAAGTFSQVWEFWKKYKIADLIEQIENEGYEVYLRPYKVAGVDRLRFQTRVEPKVLIGATTFIIGAPESPLDGIHYALSGVDEVTGLQGLGEGTGELQAVAWAGSTQVQGKPVRDVKHEFSDLAGTRLQAATNAEMKAREEPLVQFSIDRFHASESWPVEHALPGRVWNLHFRRDPMIPDGVHLARVVKVSGNITTRALSLEVQYGAS